jgi:hypothetical protein
MKRVENESYLKLSKDRVIAQAVSRTVKAGAHFQGGLFGICGERIGTWPGFTLTTSVSSYQLFHERSVTS